MHYLNLIILFTLAFSFQSLAKDMTTSSAKVKGADKADVSLQEKTIEAGISLSNTSYPDDSSNFYLDSTYRYFVADFLSLGVILTYSSYEDPEFDTKSSSTGFGPTVNYYFYTINQFAFSFGHDIVSVQQNFESNYSESEDDSYLYTRTYLQGDYFFTRNISLGLSYNVVESDDFNNNTINTKFKYYF
ncbi:hypothetical protein N9N67_07275 [Bacteriovoracaceae bacterium]|nr:hypothetical protein [Bacteriovoracaceae bacterium]